MPRCSMQSVPLCARTSTMYPIELIVFFFLGPKSFLHDEFVGIWMNSQTFSSTCVYHFFFQVVRHVNVLAFTQSCFLWGGSHEAFRLPKLTLSIDMMPMLTTCLSFEPMPLSPTLPIHVSSLAKCNLITHPTIHILPALMDREPGSVWNWFPQNIRLRILGQWFWKNESGIFVTKPIFE